MESLLCFHLSVTGGMINGKTICENLISSGGSSSAAKGPVRNPHDNTRSSGGSSSGSAVVVSFEHVSKAWVQFTEIAS